MEIFKCLVGFSDGIVGMCDGIAHEGKLWLVTGWAPHKTEPHLVPVRIVRFDSLQGVSFQPDEEPRYQNILLPISESEFLGPSPTGIEFVDYPDSLHVDTHLVRAH